jgi:tetratricopeptide (TPR) repeat protein
LGFASHYPYRIETGCATSFLRRNESSYFYPQIPRRSQIFEATRPEPPSLPAILKGELRDRLAGAIGSHNIQDVYNALSPFRDQLIEALLARLTVPTELTEPARAVKIAGRLSADLPEFTEARELLRAGRHEALDRFREVRRSRPRNPVAQEWWGYALAKYGEKQDLVEAKMMFEAVTQNKQGDWSTRWNLACLEFNLEDYESAFAVLKEMVDLSTFYEPKVFEAALRLGLIRKDNDFLRSKLPRCWYSEAAILSFSEAYDRDPRRDFDKALAQINRILSAPAWTAPHPYEDLTNERLRGICSDFKERHTVEAGIEWFKLRANHRRFRYIFLNWRLLGDLYRDAGMIREGFEAYRQELELTLKSRGMAHDSKMRTFTKILSFCRNSELKAEGLSLLERYKDDLSLDSVEVAKWSRAFGTAAEPEALPPRIPPPRPQAPREVPKEHKLAPRPEAASEAALTAPNPEKAWKSVNDAMIQLNRLRGFAHFPEHKEAFRQISESLNYLYPSSFSAIRQEIDSILGVLASYQEADDRGRKASLSHDLVVRLDVLSTLIQKQDDVRPYVQPVFDAFQRIRDELAVATGMLPEPTIEALGRLNRFLCDELIDTSLLIRIENPSPEEMSKLNVTLTSLSPSIEVTEAGKFLAVLSPRKTAIISFPVRRVEPNGQVEFRVTVSYVVAGMQHSVAKQSPVKMSSFARFLDHDPPYFIPERYVTGVPVATDQVTNFHGRDEDQRRILRSAEGGRLKRALFINGIRRVGKTSLLQSLPRVAPPEILPIVIDLRELDPGNRSNDVFLFHFARLVHDKLQHSLGSQDVSCPDLALFQTNPPDVVFVEFMKKLQEALSGRRLFLLLDEIQYVTQSAANPATRGVTDTILNMLAAQCKPDGAFLLLFTASMRYSDIRRQSSHTLWGMIFPLDISFVGKEATAQILQKPVEGDKVNYAEESLDRAWEMTRGHPWITQAIGAEVLEILNTERRLTVAPEDIDDAVERLLQVDTYAAYWWNEQFLDAWDREIAFVLLAEQKILGRSVPIVHLQEALRRKGTPQPEQRVSKLCELEIFVLDRDGTIRIKGGFLEKWLEVQRDLSQGPVEPPTKAVPTECALFVDHENLYIPLQTYVRGLPATISRLPYESRIHPKNLARALLRYAEERGTVKQKWAVADWDRIRGIKDYREAAIRIDQPFGGKNTSDWVIRERIRDVLEFYPEIGTYILVFGDADFLDTVETLLGRGKKVVIWSCKSALSAKYRRWSIEIEHVEDFLFADLEKPQVAGAQSATA